MRILHLIQRYPPAQGGAEGHLQGLSERFASEGHFVTVATTDVGRVDGFWTTNYAKIAGACVRQNGVTVRRFRIRQLPFPEITFRILRRVLVECSRRGVGSVHMLKRLAERGLAVPELYQWLRTQPQRFDIIAGMGIGFESLYTPGLDHARMNRVPFVFYPLTHLGEPNRSSRTGWFTAPSVRDYYSMRHQLAMLRACDAVMAQTATETAFLESKGIVSSRIVEAGPGVDPAGVTGGDAAGFRDLIGTNAPVILSIGVQSADKGTIHLVNAMRQLWHAGRDAHLVLVGMMMPEVSRFLARQTSVVLDRVHLLGSVSEDIKRDALAACTLLALPSRTDSFGVVLLEAWLNRKPVIGARAGGLPDVISDGKNGLLTPFGDVPALAHAIELLLQEPARCAALGDAGYKKTQTCHTWDVVYPKVRDAYERVNQNTRRRSESRSPRPNHRDT